PEPIAVYRDGGVVYANAAAARLVGADAPADVLGRPLADFVPSPDVRGLPRRLDGGKGALVMQDRILRLDGSVVEVEAVSIRITYGGQPARQVVLRDISGRRHVDQRLLHDAFHDSLTGLPNRALFHDRLEQAIKHRRRHPGYGFAVLFLDLDRFKVVNDSLGHLKGDQLLVTLAGRLQLCLREGDSVARLGGDEFAVLVADIEDLADATRVADRILEDLATPTLLDGHEIVVGASIGIALGFTGYDRPEDLLRDADTAMYRAKAAGTGGYEVFDREMHASAVALLRTESDLRRALERGEMRLHYQPIISLESGVLEGFEALLRWEHPERGLTLPAEFIRVAEETGLMLPMGWWALREACLQLRAWREESTPISPLAVHVNLSGRQLAQPDLARGIADILAETGVAPAELKLEITESVVMRDAVRAAGTLEALKELGVQLCIDDFGTGYSSLSYLNRFPVDVLKVDRSFVSGGSAVSWNIVRAILTLARDMGKRVIAEGVETPEQLGALRALGAPSAQGYIFSAAVPAAATHRIVEAWDLPARGEGGGSSAPGGDAAASRAEGAGEGEEGSGPSAHLSAG
ncbi:MAG TPA: EAL domain-containing protein, partial [Longimicrobiales bacterium]|nr:EAL domain-containing protein [Longimicrobiales bacterium]